MEGTVAAAHVTPAAASERRDWPAHLLNCSSSAKAAGIRCSTADEASYKPVKPAAEFALAC